jgi:hypothetical protein
MHKLMGDLSALSAKTETSEKKILSTAVARMEVVRKRIEELRPMAVTDDELGHEYLDLIQERAHLEDVIRLGHKRVGANADQKS